MLCGACNEKKQRHSEIEGFKYCAVDVFTFFALFLFSQTDSDCICTFLPTECLHLRNVSFFCKNVPEIALFTNGCNIAHF